MSTVNEVEGNVREFSYATYLGNNVGGDVASDTYSDVLPKIVHTVMTQLALKKGLEAFGDRGKEAVSSELLQIHMQDTFAPTHGGDMMSQE